MMSPPLPPSPPSGPPSGANFSRRKLTMPEPPLPAVTRTMTRSMNIAVGPTKVDAGCRHATSIARTRAQFAAGKLLTYHPREQEAGRTRAFCPDHWLELLHHLLEHLRRHTYV